MMTKEDLPLILTAKKAAGKAAADLIENGMLIGLGTGSTAAFFIEALGQRCQEFGLQISAVATSMQSKHQAQLVGIPLMDETAVSSLDITVDGADEIDPHKNMIKGGGGALLREKLLAQSSREMIVIVDENKLVPTLKAFPVPVEISAFVYQTTIYRLIEQGYKGNLRLNRDGSPFKTDNGNYIVDVQFIEAIINPQKEHERLKNITGVIETGLFFNIAGRVIVGYEDGLVRIQA